MDSKRIKLAGLAMQSSSSGLTNSEFTLQNYFTENQEAGFNYIFNGKPISDLVSKFAPNPAQAAMDLLKTTYSDGEELQPEIGVRFAFLMIKDREKFLNGLLGNIDSKDKTVKVRAMRSLSSLLGVKHEPAGKMELTEAETYYTSLLDKERVKGHMDDTSTLLGACEVAEKTQELPPLEALASIAGADRPWVRSRLQKSLNPNVWYMTNVSNFNTSPKDVLDGFLQLAASGKAKQAELQEFYTKIWERPDFVSFMRTKESMSVKEEGTAHKKDLKDFLSFSPLLDISPSMSVFELLAREFDVYQPSFFVISELKQRGMSDTQAELRASFAERLAKETDQRKIDAAARRLLGLSYPSEPIIKDPRTLTVGHNVGPSSLMQKFNNVVSEYIIKTKEFLSQPEARHDTSDVIVESKGLQSWEEKDQAIRYIESQLTNVMVTPTLILDSDIYTTPVPESVKSDIVTEGVDRDGPPLEAMEAPSDIDLDR